MSSSEKWCDYSLAREAFFTKDVSRSEFDSMDHADVVTWHTLAREAEQAERAALSLEAKYGPRSEGWF